VDAENYKIVLLHVSFNLICMYYNCIVVVLLWINVNLWQYSNISINGTIYKQNRVHKIFHSVNYIYL